MNKKLIIKLLVSITLILWVIIYKMDWTKLAQIASNINIGLIALSFSLHTLGFLFSVLRWQKLLDYQKVKVGFWPLMDSYIIGAFFNVFMPTRIGGDVVRVNDLKTATKSLTKSASIIFVERFLGISVLLIFALIASLFRISYAKEIPAIWAGLALGTIGLCAFVSILYMPFVGKIFGWIPIKKISEKLVDIWIKFQTNSKEILSNPKALFWGLFYSVLLQINVVLHYWLIGKALNFDVMLLDYFFLIPVQLVILMVPTINGIGLREASNIVLFGYYGLSATAAATFGFIDFSMLLVIGFVGWLRFLTRKTAPAASN